MITSRLPQPVHHLIRWGKPDGGRAAFFIQWTKHAHLAAFSVTQDAFDEAPVPKVIVD